MNEKKDGLRESRADSAGPVFLGHRELNSKRIKGPSRFPKNFRRVKQHAKKEEKHKVSQVTMRRPLFVNDFVMRFGGHSKQGPFADRAGKQPVIGKGGFTFFSDAGGPLL
ncbi:MAG TPA: hypothetical protein PLR20_13175 [Syntrophales bacterium]|nr:hypothetical protein [Syntrophales bacterium]HOX95531.1 hypothetical protein [Syntrophales bacterium]HPI56714.1 hypothetical protein [Syntrophales bacterium]HPN24861.1 hypothetical protein [Syntrophales bacterium]HQM30296.1 hypothetical protein [Syntrophales bacterium]